MAVQRLAIIGTGLIGTSVALAAKRTGSPRVSAFDPDPAALAAAAARGAVDDPSDSLAGALDGAELAVVAAPVAQLAAEVSTVLDASADDCTVTDVGSTKAAATNAARSS